MRIPMTLRDAIQQTTRQLAQAGLADAARLEAQWLCGAALGGLTPPQIIQQATRILTAAEAAVIGAWSARRAAGEPLQYILGDVEFCGLRIEVGPGVLIPRPETEGLVTLALQALGRPPPPAALGRQNSRCKMQDSTSAPAAAPVLDLCTGSGCIALAVGHSAGQDPVYAVDLSPDALRYARKNQAALGINNVRFLEGDLYAPLPPALRFAVITANPPYIAPPFYDQLPPEVKAHEPELALRAEEDGLAVFRRIAEGARDRLLPGGWLFCELSSEQTDAACAILSRNGFAEVAMLPDCFEKPRFAIGCHQPASPGGKRCTTPGL